MRDSVHPWLSRLLLVYAGGLILFFVGTWALAGVVAVLIVVPLMEWGYASLPSARRASTVRMARIVGAPLVAIAAALVVRDWRAIVSGGRIGAVEMAALVVVASAYVLAGLYPGAVGQWLAAGLRGGPERASWWDLADAVACRRTWFRRAFGALVLLLAGAAAALLGPVRSALFPHASDAWLALAGAGLLAGVAVLAWARAWGLGWPVLPEVGDAGALAAARRAVEGVALAAGIAVPQVTVVAHVRPTAFTVVRRSGPGVTFTTGLIAMLPAAEMEAVAAHEVGHIASRGAESSHATESLLDLLRLLGAVVLVLYLLATGAAVGAPWAVLVAALAAGGLIEHASDDADRRPARSVEAWITLVNPMMVLTNVLAYFFFFALGQDEDLLADLRAVELTRNPDAMHAVLRRLRNAHPVGPPLPMAYRSLYFTAEPALPGGYPSPQASIEARLAALERLDPGLRAAPPVRPRPMPCPDCGSPLERRAIESRYGAPVTVDRCPACGGIWFDDLELYLIGALGLIEASGKPSSTTAADGPGACPRCRVRLRRLPPLGMPADVRIWECLACRGAWVRPQDLARFGQFRGRREARGRASRP